FGLDFFDERQHVAHAENSLRYTVGIERFERIVTLTNTNEFHRLPGNLLDRKCRAATSVAVHLRQDYAGNSHAAMKLFSGANGVLTGHGIGNEEDLNRMSLLLNVDQLFH